MDWITDSIAIGDYEDAQGDRPRKAGITAVLNVCFEREDFPPHREYERNGVVYAKVPIIDGKENDILMLMAAVDVLYSLLKAGHKVLVHCGAGVSRSPTIVYLCLTLRLGVQAEESKRLVSKRRGVRRDFDDYLRLVKTS